MGHLRLRLAHIRTIASERLSTFGMSYFSQQASVEKCTLDRLCKQLLQSLLSPAAECLLLEDAPLRPRCSQHCQWLNRRKHRPGILAWGSTHMPRAVMKGETRFLAVWWWQLVMRVDQRANNCCPNFEVFAIGLLQKLACVVRVSGRSHVYFFAMAALIMKTKKDADECRVWEWSSAAQENRLSFNTAWQILCFLCCEWQYSVNHAMHVWASHILQWSRALNWLYIWAPRCLSLEFDGLTWVTGSTQTFQHRHW